MRVLDALQTPAEIMSLVCLAVARLRQHSVW